MHVAAAMLALRWPVSVPFPPRWLVSALAGGLFFCYVHGVCSDAPGLPLPQHHSLAAPGPRGSAQPAPSCGLCRPCPCPSSWGHTCCTELSGGQAVSLLGFALSSFLVGWRPSCLLFRLFGELLTTPEQACWHRALSRLLRPRMCRSGGCFAGYRLLHTYLEASRLQMRTLRLGNVASSVQAPAGCWAGRPGLVSAWALRALRSWGQTGVGLPPPAGPKGQARVGGQKGLEPSPSPPTAASASSPA